VTAERPVVAQYEPEGHAVHELEEEEDAYDPDKQLEQTVADAAE